MARSARSLKWPSDDERATQLARRCREQAIVDFVAQTDSVPVEHRIAVFDNDGTLW
jgi:hypothetical protein